MRELSLNVLDVAQNSIAAGASLITVALAEDSLQDLLTIEISDDGRGMTAQQLKQVTDPFYTTRTTRKVGLGVSLFKMAAEMAGGTFSVESAVGKGTTVKATFRRSHVDCMPIGDMCATMVLLISMNPDRDFVYKRSFDGAAFTLDTRELREMLGDVSLSEPEVVDWMTAYIGEQTQIIRGGANYENA